MAVADHVFDGGPLPPVLAQAFDFQLYGVNVLELDPGVFAGLRTAYNSYVALSGYKNATGKTVEWSNHNPEAWKFTAQVLKYRKELRAQEKKNAP